MQGNNLLGDLYFTLKQIDLKLCECCLLYFICYVSDQ
jgi:hypothetical protein